MKREHRLKHSHDFARVRTDGRSWSHRLLVLAAISNELGLSRFGYIVSGRLGKAVRRNRAKRLLREAVRRNLLCLPEGWDCVLIARTALAAATFSEVESAVVELFKRASLWRDPSQAQRLSEAGAGCPGTAGQMAA
jgi:ribonuclease P protein component